MRVRFLSCSCYTGANERLGSFIGELLLLLGSELALGVSNCEARTSPDDDFSFFSSQFPPSSCFPLLFLGSLFGVLHEDFLLG